MRSRRKKERNENPPELQDAEVNGRKEDDMRLKLSACGKWIVVFVLGTVLTGFAGCKTCEPKNMERQLRLNDALFDAAEKGQTNLVRSFVQQGANVDVRGVAGKDTKHPTNEWTPLLLASDKGYTKIASILIENGADIHAQNYAARTPLHVAALKGHAEIVKMLIAKGADVHASSAYDQWTPLHAAAYNGQTTVALILLKAGADPFIKNVQDATPLDYAKKRGLNTVVKTIEEMQQGKGSN